MNAVDTNILIYRLDASDPAKQAKARVLLRRLGAASEPTVLLWQVLGESMRQLRSWQDQGQIDREAFRRYIAVIRGLFPLGFPTARVVDYALDLTTRHSLQHWDSMLLGACKDAGVTTLYAEDMGAPIAYDGTQLINPFI